MRISDWSSDVCSSDLVRRADNKPLGAVSGEAVDGREGLLAVGHGDLDHREAPVLTGLFGERPFGLEPGLLGLLEQKTDLHFFGRQQAAAEAERSHRQGGKAQGTDPTKQIPSCLLADGRPSCRERGGKYV